MGVDVTLHFWSLDLPENQRLQQMAVLSPDEIARVARFVYDKHRFAYLAARAGLRNRLGAEMGVPPRSLDFAYGPQGKPSLPDGPSFNLSHAGDTACLAIHPTCPLGVDIEAYRNVEDGVAKRFFSLSENATLATLPKPATQAGFFRCWTRKEAIIKAIGGGLSIPLDAFDVTLTPDEPAQLLRLDPAYGDVADWKIAPITFGADMAGAVAAKTDGAPLRLHLAELPDGLSVSV